MFYQMFPPLSFYTNKRWVGTRLQNLPENDLYFQIYTRDYFYSRSPNFDELRKMLRQFIRNSEDETFITYPEVKPGIHLLVWRDGPSICPWNPLPENVHPEPTCWFLYSNTWCWSSNRSILLAIQWIFISTVRKKWRANIAKSGS